MLAVNMLAVNMPGVSLIVGAVASRIAVMIFHAGPPHNFFTAS